MIASNLHSIELFDILKSIIDKDHEKNYLSNVFRGYDLFFTDSGKSSLKLILDSYNIRKGDKILMPSYTCESVIVPIRKLGINALQVDVDSGLVTSGSNFTRYKDFSDIKAILVIHMYGSTAEIDELYKISKKYNIPLIEDSCQYFTTEFNSYCETSFFSFNFGKPITAGHGSLIITKNKDISNNIQKFNLVPDKSFLKSIKIIIKLFQYHFLSYKLVYKLLYPKIKLRRKFNFNESFGNAEIEVKPINQISLNLVKKALKKFNRKERRRKIISKYYKKIIDKLKTSNLTNLSTNYNLTTLRFAILSKDIKISEISEKFEKSGIDVTSPYKITLNNLSENKVANFESDRYPESLFVLPTHDNVGISDVNKITKVLVQLR